MDEWGWFVHGDDQDACLDGQEQQEGWQQDTGTQSFPTGHHQRLKRLAQLREIAKRAVLAAERPADHSRAASHAVQFNLMMQMMEMRGLDCPARQTRLAPNTENETRHAGQKHRFIGLQEMEVLPPAPHHNGARCSQRPRLEAHHARHHVSPPPASRGTAISLWKAIDEDCDVKLTAPRRGECAGTGTG
jgi:hypothetical protein